MHGIITADDHIAFNLERARLLIDHPDKWVQEKYEYKGKRCAIQALRDVAWENEDLLHTLVITLAGHEDNEPESTITNFNDHHSHAEVMDYFNSAISRVRSLKTLRMSCV